MRSVDVIVPLAGDDPDRLAAWEFLSGRYQDRGFSLTVVSGDSQPWVKAELVNRGIEQARSEVVVVADADVWAEGLRAAIEWVQERGAWAIPHRGVYRLTEAGTAAYRGNQGAMDAAEMGLEQDPYLGYEGGGIVVARRELLLEIPMDPRFVGWGGEDFAWGTALRTLAGPPLRVKYPLIHLYHPPQERMNRKHGSPAGRRLARRYDAAKNDPDRMRALIEEVRDVRATAAALHADHTRAVR